FGDHHGETGAGEIEQRVAQRLALEHIQLDLHDAGELSGELAHTALEPVATVLADGVCEPLDQPRFICTDKREHHGIAHLNSPLTRAGMGAGELDGRWNWCRRNMEPALRKLQGRQYNEAAVAASCIPRGTTMKVIVDFCIIPLGVELSLSRYIAECQRILEGLGLKHELHAYGTNIEGEWDTVMDAIKRCHHRVHEMGAPRITTT